MKELCTTALCVLCSGIVLASPGQEDDAPLWRIGLDDDGTAEFAHAPGNYQDYRRPAFFVVGVSDPATDWPYVQPGTIDGGWAPGTPQTFEVHFGLGTVPEEGTCRLTLDFVDTHSIDPPRLGVEINGREVAEFETPPGAGDASVFGQPSLGREFVEVVEVPVSVLRAGNNRVAITTVEGSWVLWDHMTFETPAGAVLSKIAPETMLWSVFTSPVLKRRGEELVQPVSVHLYHLGDPITYPLRIGNAEPVEVELRPGITEIEASIPHSEETRWIDVSLEREGTYPIRSSFELQPARDWEIHLVHQTHLDIGFTHTQEEVLQIQLQHLRTALELIEKTRDYPEEARFRWHPEGMWAVEEFMRTADEDERERFIAACRDKLIHIDALYAQAMTGMYTEEGLFELVGAAKRFGEEHGIEVVSAMQSDVPGYTWGLASALSHNGIRYLTVGPNWFASGGPDDYFLGDNIVGRTHRGGRVFAWADQPFWWVDPSGEHRVLLWMPGWGYSGFHGNRGAISEAKVFAYLQHLEETDYPYEMVLWRYGIGADNGPPSPDLCDVVKSWNERFASPRLIVTSNSEVMKTFEARYGDRLPVARGDYTPYWEDGCASTSKATAAYRQGCERLAQARILWALHAPQDGLHERFDAAWQKLIMYGEHTWGAYCSISRPDDPFSVQQDEYKQAFAFDGENQATGLLELYTEDGVRPSWTAVDVFNTANWPRDGLVFVPHDRDRGRDEVLDARGRPVPAQRLTSGRLHFLARDVPAFGARRYTFGEGEGLSAGEAWAKGNELGNGLLTVRINPDTGTIESALDKNGVEWVDTGPASGWNDYLYIIGRDASKNRSRPEGEVKITVEEPGPLVATLRVESSAPGCLSLTRRITLIDGFDHVELENTVHKLRERRPEGVYFGFPFALEEVTARVDAPLAIVEVEKDQLRGANRNFYCVQRWVDLSNSERGVTWVTLDAPMLQFDPIRIAPAFGVEHWREHLEPEPFLHSWVMNNHWETNYKADQEGELTYRYAIRPHAGGFDAMAAQRFGRDRCQPLLPYPADPAKPCPTPALSVRGDGVVVTSIEPTREGRNGALLVRVFAASGEKEHFALRWREPRKVFLSDPAGKRGAPVEGPIELAPFGIVTLRVEHE